MFRHSTFNRFIGTFYRPDKKIKHCANTIIDTMPYYFVSTQYQLILTQRRKQLVVLRL